MSQAGTDVIYVATIDIKYPVMSAARTESEAIQLASRKAYADLKSSYGVPVDTPEELADYYGVTVTKLAIGTAANIGN